MKSYKTGVFFAVLLSCFPLDKFQKEIEEKVEKVENEKILEIEFNEILPYIKATLEGLGFVVKIEEKHLLVTFPKTLPRKDFQLYAVGKEGDRYFNLTEEILYPNPVVEVHCVLLEVIGGKTLVKIKPIFEAFKKDLYYKVSQKDTPLKDKDYYEIEGEFINCVSLGKLEKEFFSLLETKIKEKIDN